MKATTTKIALAAAAAMLLAAAAYRMLQHGNPNASKAGAAAEQAAPGGAEAVPAKLAIEEPFENVKTKAEELLIENPGRPSTLRLASGTVLTVPANAFVNVNGGPVAGPVRLRFREFHEAADIIASGIPMRIPKAEGEEGWLQTAGMFEIYGTSEGQAVEIAPGKAIEVDLASRVGGDYDFWIFDRQSGQWANQGPAGAPQQEAIGRDEIEAEVGALRSRTARRPTEPQVTPEEEKLVFTDLDTRSCPELAGRKPVALAYAGDNKAEDPKNNQWISDPGIWRKKTLKPSGKAGVYELTLLGDKVYRIPVRLALEGKSLEQARQEYQRALASYQADVELLRDREALLRQQAAFRRSMSVAGFGIYNYDILWKRGDSVPLMADFEFEGMPQALKQQIMVCLVTGNDRTVACLPYGDWDKLRISPSADNKLIAVLPGDKVAVFSQSDFDREMEAIRQAGGSRYVFNMKVQEQPLGSVESLQQILDRASS